MVNSARSGEPKRFAQWNQLELHVASPLQRMQEAGCCRRSAKLAEVSSLWVAFRLPMRCDHSRARKQSGMISWRTGNDRLLDDDGRLGISAAEKLRRK